ncbi:MAG: Gfo/Idh/MocA family oxidoreductase [Gemmatimonadetes bacterium]|nr:Gfo/Idh/MocA family oxidoreductase [Gemmatimonadota bacterium]MBT7860365.1 Gfo/Idh/MocA family oxidoreductase [Gemmatimonadota bacterium]
MDLPLNVAVIGCGMLARQQHIPNIIHSERMQLHTCCDLDEAALTACRQTAPGVHTSTDFHETVADAAIDLVVLTTTEAVRLPVIGACSRVGKPMYVEKPLAGTLEELSQIEAVVGASGIRVCVGHNRRSSPAMLEAHGIFRSHMVSPAPCAWRFDREGADERPPLPDDGAPCMSVRINDDWYSWKGWVFDEEQARFGPMLFEMTHFTDLCNWFMGTAPVEVTALEGGMLNHGVVIGYEGGGIATISMAGNGTFGYPKELYEVCGHGGIVAVDHMLEIRTAGIESAPARITYPMLADRHPQIGTEGGLFGWLEKKRQACAEAAAAGDDALIFTAEPDKGHAAALERFIDEVQGDGPVVCGVADAALATRVAFAAIRSAQERRPVKISEI